MATFFKIARGSKASLERYEKKDGTFYVIADPDNEVGELYGDIKSGDEVRRIKFGGGAVAKRAEEWGDEQSSAGTFYIVSDAYGEDLPGLKIGDGVNTISDLPIVTISQQQVDSWNNKVRAIDPAEGSENLVFTTN